jgi:hypothetical protein
LFSIIEIGLKNLGIDYTDVTDPNKLNPFYLCHPCAISS